MEITTILTYLLSAVFIFIAGFITGKSHQTTECGCNDTTTGDFDLEEEENSDLSIK